MGSAAVTLVKGDLAAPCAWRLSRITKRNIRDDLFFSFVLNGAGCRSRRDILFDVQTATEPSGRRAAMALQLHCRNRELVERHAEGRRGCWAEGDRERFGSSGSEAAVHIGSPAQQRNRQRQTLRQTQHHDRDRRAHHQRHVGAGLVLEHMSGVWVLRYISANMTTVDVAIIAPKRAENAAFSPALLV